MSRQLVAPLLALLFAIACSPTSGQASAGLQALPPDWDACSPARFERLLERQFPDDGRVRALDPAARSELRAALELPELDRAGADAPDARAPADVQRGLRAVLILARSHDPEGPPALLEQLTARRTHPGRADDASECVAAAFLGTLGAHPASESFAVTLAALADGPEPHPDLEVRTECALAALALDNADVLPFLLRVARIGTPSAEGAGRLTNSPTTAWVRGRAVDALRERLGLPLEPFTDLGAAEREGIVDALERRLLPD